MKVKPTKALRCIRKGRTAPAKTMICCASRTVLRRCAMRSTVRPVRTVASAAWIAASVPTSRLRETGSGGALDGLQKQSK
jgi:hypothetical protein